MKRIRLYIMGAFILLVNLPLSAQVLDGKYYEDSKAKSVTVTYTNSSPVVIKKIMYDGKDLIKLKGELEKKVSDLQKELNDCRRGGGRTPTKVVDLEKQVNDLMDSVQTLNKTIDRIVFVKKMDAEEQIKTIDSLANSLGEMGRSLAERQRQVDSLREVLRRSGSVMSDNCMHIGLQYRIGLPQLLNPLLAQMDDQGEKIWSRNLTLSHHVGLFYGTASLVENFPLSIGVGVEYDQLRFKAGIGHLDNTIQQAMDADNDPYTAYLSYDNVLEDITLRYVSIPVSLSFGQPYMDRISGYGQFTIAPSICVAQKLSSSGIYSLAGYYSQLSGSDVDLYMDDMSSLGFGSGFEVADVQKSVSVSRFVLVGRLSAGFYLPLCNLKKGKSSPCVFKMGVSVDITCTPIAKDLGNDTAMPEAQYRLQQYNLLNGQGCRYVCPALEVGLLYLIKKH